MEGQEDAVGEELVGREELRRGFAGGPELELQRGGGGAAAAPRVSFRGRIHLEEEEEEEEVKNKYKGRAMYLSKVRPWQIFKMPLNI